MPTQSQKISLATEGPAQNSRNAIRISTAAEIIIHTCNSGERTESENISDRNIAENGLTGSIAIRNITAIERLEIPGEIGIENISHAIIENATIRNRDGDIIIEADPERGMFEAQIQGATIRDIRIRDGIIIDGSIVDGIITSARINGIHSRTTTIANAIIEGGSIIGGLIKSRDIIVRRTGSGDSPRTEARELRAA